MNNQASQRPAETGGALQRLKDLAGVDIHIFTTVLFRSWGILAGGVTLVLLPLWLSPAQQGYYYTFASLLALQVFFELGMGQVVIQIAAHEAVHLSLSADGRYKGGAEHLARVEMLRRLLGRWYLPAALLFLVVVSVAGLVFFRRGGLAWQEWAMPWSLLVGASAVNLYFSWKLALVEGFALVRHVAQLRLKQSMIGYVLMWIGLIAGAGLWVVAAVPTMAAIITALWLRSGPAAAVLGIRSEQQPEQPIRWSRDIFPFQWRIAVSWISGYFIMHLFTPLLFRQSGAAEAGRLGLAMTIFNAISIIGMSWVNAKAPNFSMLISRHESALLLDLFKVVALRSLLVTAAISVAVLLGAWVCTALDLPLMRRVASLPVLTCLALVTVVNAVTFAAAQFMRAHREEPMLAASIACGILTGLAAWWVSRYGAATMMAAYCAITTLVSLPWTLLIFRRYVARHRRVRSDPARDCSPDSSVPGA